MTILAELERGPITTAQALDKFDELEPVDVDFMIGHWRGEGCPTDHPMDGLLEAYHWYGKKFESTEKVHPLVFSTMTGRLASVNPAWMTSSMKLAVRGWAPKGALAGRAFQLLMPLLTTSKPRARLRMTHYRGKSSATMVYDQLPINDVFRKLDDNTVLGAMDFRGMARPFFFILHRLSDK